MEDRAVRRGSFTTADDLLLDWLVPTLGAVGLMTLVRLSIGHAGVALDAMSLTWWLSVGFPVSAAVSVLGLWMSHRPERRGGTGDAREWLSWRIVGAIAPLAVAALYTVFVVTNEALFATGLLVGTDGYYIAPSLFVLVALPGVLLGGLVTWAARHTVKGQLP